MPERADLGRRGEAVAAAHLVERGYEILDRNVRTRFGEIDLVALDGPCIVFVEVRTVHAGGPLPEESITQQKQRRIASLGMRYLQAHGRETADWRADVVAIEFGSDGRVVRLAHHVNAVELS